jgi:hypothetical protein
VTLKAKKSTKKRLIFFRDTSLMLAMFLLPFGYDALFKLIMDLSGSYWVADITFYSISGCFWLSYIFPTRLLSKDKSLMFAMFFLPLGYDALFKYIMDLSGSYWIADITFYTTSGFFWLLYIWLSRKTQKTRNLDRLRVEPKQTPMKAVTE